MQTDREIDGEQAILEAAEAEFLEKGYDGAKTVAIAKRAGISHSMLHYYFRKKENLFQMIFQKKIQIISQHFENIFGKELPFEETVKLLMETQFDFLAKNPQLPRFIISEILPNEKHRTMLFNEISPKTVPIIKRIETLLKSEEAKGKIRHIKLEDFVMNAASLNVFTFLILSGFSNIGKHSFIKRLLNKRKDSNIQFILNALRP